MNMCQETIELMVTLSKKELDDCGVALKELNSEYQRLSSSIDKELFIINSIKKRFRSPRKGVPKILCKKHKKKLDKLFWLMGENNLDFQELTRRTTIAVEMIGLLENNGKLLQ